MKTYMAISQMFLFSLYLPAENLSSTKYSQIRNFGYKTNANINPLMNKVYV